mgnify:CR=1 FL=1
MQYIANIIGGQSGTGFLYNFVEKSSDCIPGLPILVVGWENANRFYKDKVNVLNRKIDDMTYWTYSKYERREEYEKDTRKFLEFALNSIADKIKYTYFDIVLESEVNKKNLVNSYSKSVYYESRNMIYIYISDRNTVLGISKVQLAYFGYRSDIFIRSMITKGAKNLTLKSSLIPKDIWRIYQWRRYMIPVLLSML